MPVSESFQVAAVVTTADFSLSSNPTIATLTAGQTGTFTLTATPQGSVNSPISFSCNGLPAMANCTFNPATVTPIRGGDYDADYHYHGPDCVPDAAPVWPSFHSSCSLCCVVGDARDASGDSHT